MRTQWRVWSSILLALAALAQVPGAVSLMEPLGYLDELNLGYQAGLGLFFVALGITALAFLLALLGQRIPALVLASLALAASIITLLTYMVTDIVDGTSVVDSFRFEVLGLETDPDSGATAFWPSTFLAGFPTWALLVASVVILATGRAATSSPGPMPDVAMPDVATSVDGDAGEQAQVAAASAPPGWYPGPDGGPPAYWDGQRWSRPQ